MAAPKAKDQEKDKTVQIIVFLPVNGDPDSDDDKIYMVCPSSLRVVEVVEKDGDAAEEYLNILNKKLKKSAVSSKTFIEDLGKSVDVEDSIVDEDDAEGLHEKALEDDDITTLSEELDEDIITFASDALGDIYPEEGSDPGAKSATGGDPSVDLETALDMLDQDDDPEQVKELAADFSEDDDSMEIPTL